MKQPLVWYGKTLVGAWRARRAYARARCRGLPKNDFYRLGRFLGWKLLSARRAIARQLLWSPVSITRYFEFDFAWRALTQDGFVPSSCLDVSSPFLFSIQVAHCWPEARVKMLNPDARDLQRTRQIRDLLHWDGIELVEAGSDFLDGESAGAYDAAWSISVVEHIAGEQGDDRDAVRRMWNVVRPGGRLIVTVPTDRQAWDEYRETDVYGLQPKSGANASYFFQRFYDEAAIHGRLIQTIGQKPARMEWFGEKMPGHFHAYIARWRREGAPATLNDPLDIAMNYQLYPSFSDMPGAGVCGLSFIKQ